VKIEEILKSFGRKQKRRTLDHVEDFTTMLGPESVYMGVFQGKDNHIIYGEVQGECDLEGILVLGEGSRWKGNIRAGSIVVAGRVEGDIQANEKLELAQTAYVSGKITSPIVAIARGAVHEGTIRMNNETQITRFVDRRESDDPMDPESTEA